MQNLLDQPTGAVTVCRSASGRAALPGRRREPASRGIRSASAVIARDEQAAPVVAKHAVHTRAAAVRRPRARPVAATAGWITKSLLAGHRRPHNAQHGASRARRSRRSPDPGPADRRARPSACHRCGHTSSTAPCSRSSGSRLHRTRTAIAADGPSRWNTCRVHASRTARYPAGSAASRAAGRHVVLPPGLLGDEHRPASSAGFCCLTFGEFQQLGVPVRNVEDTPGQAAGG